MIVSTWPLFPSLAYAAFICFGSYCLSLWTVRLIRRTPLKDPTDAIARLCQMRMEGSAGASASLLLPFLAIFIFIALKTAPSGEPFTSLGSGMLGGILAGLRAGSNKPR